MTKRDPNWLPDFSDLTGDYDPDATKVRYADEMTDRPDELQIERELEAARTMIDAMDANSIPGSDSYQAPDNWNEPLYGKFEPPQNTRGRPGLSYEERQWVYDNAEKHLRSKGKIQRAIELRSTNAEQAMFRKFSEMYPEHAARDPDELRAAVAHVTQNLRDQGIDPARYATQEYEDFFADIVAVLR